MIRRFCIIAVLFLSLFPAFCQEKSAPDELSADHQEVLRLAQLIRQDPVSEQARRNYAAIFSIVEKDERIAVTIAQDNIPWFGELQNDKRNAFLLGAFVTGNAEAQVLEKKMGDNPYAGNLFVILAYGKMKEADKTFTCQAIEKFIELEKAGKLEHSFAAKKPAE